MKITILRAAAATTLALLASACADQKKLQFCPGMTSVLDASMETVFRPGTSPDPANALYTLRISDVSGDCSYDKKGRTSDSSLDISFEATRPAPGPAAQYTVQYFVAVTQADRVVDRVLRPITFAFDPGQTSSSASDHVSSVELVTDGDKKPYDYQVLVGLQLSKAQLDYNRSVGIFQK